MSFSLTGGTTASIVQGAPATLDAAGFGALTYVKIGEIESYSAFGNTANLSPFTSVDDSLERQEVGSVSAGTLTLTCALDEADAGQAICDAAVDTTDPSFRSDFSLEIVLPSGTIVYYLCKISSSTIEPADVNAVIRSTITLPLNSNKVVV